METSTMGRVIVQAKIENLEDAYRVRRGDMSSADARILEVDEALVDTGETGLSMPTSLIARLGLLPGRRRRARTSAGPVELQMYDAVRLTIQGRECFTDVTEVPDDCPVLIGQIPLEALDFVVDMPGQRLIGNPRHGGEHQIELY